MKRKVSGVVTLILVIFTFFALTSFEASAQMEQSEMKSRLASYSSWFTTSDKNTFTVTCPTYDLTDDRVFTHINNITSLLRGDIIDDYCEIVVKFRYSGSNYKNFASFSTTAFTLEDKLKVYWTNWSETNQMDVECSYTQSSSTGRVYTTSVLLSLNGSNPDDNIRDYDEKIKRITEKAKKAGSNDMEIVQYLCNWLDNNVDYSLFYQYTNSPYVAVMKGKGVCGSYANALKDMCELLGIPSIVPVNQDELNHAWNEVYVNGKWYTVDLCNVIEPADGKYNGYCFLNPDRKKYPVDHYSFIEKHKEEYVATFTVSNPDKFKATASETSVKISWNSVPGATGYRVYLYNPQDKSYTKLKKVTTATSYTATNLKPGTKYRFAFKSYVKKGSKIIWSKSFSTFYTSTKPLPVSLKATQTAKSITLSWDKVSGASGYRVYLYNTSKKSLKALDTTKKTTYTVSSLKAGTKYTFAVKAYIGTGTTTHWSSYSLFTTSTTPSAPTVTLSSGSPGKVTVKWTSSGDVTGYQIYYSRQKTSGYKKLTNTATGGTFSFAKGVKFYIKVRAYTKTPDGYIYSTFSPVKSVTVK